jgi:hypothetical protein
MSDAAIAAADYLRDVSPVLWPPPARSRLSRGRSPGTAWICVPSAAAPSLLVPARSTRAAASIVRRYAESRSLIGRTRTEVLATAFRVGVADVAFRDRLVLDGTAPHELTDRLAAALGEPVTFGLHIGPARANRKPVLTVATRDGRVVAYAKIGISPLTCRLVRSEAAALRRLADARLPDLQIPGVVIAEPWGNGELLVQSALPVWRRRVSVDERRLTRAMLAVAAVGGTASAPIGQSGAWAMALAQLESLATPVAGQLRSVAHELLAAANPVVAIGAWHGDWHPANMAVLGDRMLLWDWERFDTGVPIGFDRLHYSLQHALTVDKMMPVDAAAMLCGTAAGDLQPLGVPEDQAGAVVGAYLVHLGARYLYDGQAAAGRALGRIEEWLVPTLHRLVTELVARRSR